MYSHVKSNFEFSQMSTFLLTYAHRFQSCLIFSQRHLWWSRGWNSCSSWVTKSTRSAAVSWYPHLVFKCHRL